MQRVSKARPTYVLSGAEPATINPRVPLPSSCTCFLSVHCLYACLQLVGPPRVWLKTAPFPGLNMSRSYGDVIGKQAGVISVPHCTAQPLTPNDHVLVLGSDGVRSLITSVRHVCIDGGGAHVQLSSCACLAPCLQLWDWMKNEEAVSIALSSADTCEAASRLARLARSRWLVRTGGADDTTVVLVRISARGGGASHE